jgi:CubicO group peptidase (beta-lactamase class C family)
MPHRSRFARGVTVLAGVLAATTALSLITVAVAAPATGADDESDAYVAAQVQSAHIPGLVVGIVHADGTTHVRGFGVANPIGEAISPRTPFLIGSLSKSFTALAIMQLVEQGKLDLDAPVERYLPDFGTTDRAISSTITPRQLLNQTSGIPKSAVKELQAGTGDETIDDAVRRLSGVQLTGPVGATFQYSNMNYVTLGLLVQVISGEPYATYIQRHIFEPLGMHDSFATLPPPHQPSLATPYHWVFGVPVAGDVVFESSLVPAGFLISSAEDMTHYLAAQLDGGAYAGTRVVSPGGTDEMHRAAADMHNGGSQYAMGWVRGQLGGNVSVWHDGTTTVGFASHVVLLPERHIGVVVLSNVYSFGPADFADPLSTIAEGVAVQQPGDVQAPNAVNLTTAFVIFDALALVLMLLAVDSLVQLLRGRTTALRRRPVAVVLGVVLPLVWELVLPLGLVALLVLPLLGPLPVMFLAAPDVTWWLLTLSVVLFVTGVTRITLAVFNLHGARNTADRVGARSVINPEGTLAR